ncbi:thermonuclease family protein [Methylobacterium durans]|uniref:thermonuclease family protein n=1 Tax=Methylobacterium durans TaxID=2202825 RepID=UPI002B0019F1|nr:thermonuclease family protein [Methylobacterium durans]MEA1832596.1 thermonuclease family protein [Methylobacterium durans]
MLIGLSLLAALAPEASRSGESLSGRAVVIDGDTLNLRGKIIGLFGIAAPGPTQTCLDAGGRSYSCGTASARALAAHLGTAIIACETREPDRHGRILATCRKGEEDLGAWLTLHGHAAADRRVSAAYVPDETMAWAKRRGLWAGAFDDPTLRQRDPYAATNRYVAAQPDAPASDVSATASTKR